MRQNFIKDNNSTRQLNKTLEVKNLVSGDKDTNFDSSDKENLVIYKDIANQQAVKEEIGDVLLEFDSIIRDSIDEVNESRLRDNIKYSQRGYYSQDLNATIKSKILKRIGSDSNFSNKIQVKTNSGSVFFIVKNKYVLYVKRLYGQLNKPKSYPTPSSNKLYAGKLFPELAHIPYLFIGPNLGSEGNNSFVTSLISKHEVNWTQATMNLFETDTIDINRRSEDSELNDQISILHVKENVKIKRRNIK
ncbi:hypothetical protein [Faecalibacter rhinopitheci]|uniref:Uncharacterized protein n=1 Tax=Faecalibacter rhinopitheci TaxID=2779678 RepID=A0A8J7KA09_9FLAO|nr:hypothetical protein [Faecalibacter rhinopitheci]MBF0596905.1 hypothetical protein [Faecalibacter rhinopitheci]